MSQAICTSYAKKAATSDGGPRRKVAGRPQGPPSQERANTEKEGTRPQQLTDVCPGHGPEGSLGDQAGMGCTRGLTPALSPGVPHGAPIGALRSMIARNV